MKFKFCDLAHYSAMNLESFLNRNDIKFIKKETTNDQIERLYDITIMRNEIKFIKHETSNDQIERLYDITIMTEKLSIYAYDNYVRIGVISDGVPIYATKIHITDFSELKIF